MKPDDLPKPETRQLSRKVAIVIRAACLLFPLSACTQRAPAPVGVTPPMRSYADCILEKVRPGLSDLGVEYVTEACKAKFPKPGMFDDIPKAASNSDNPYMDLVPPKPSPPGK